MSQKSLIESLETISAWRLLVAANRPSLQPLSAVYTQIQIQREGTVIPLHVETPKNFDLNTSVAAPHDDNCGLSRVLAHGMTEHSACALATAAVLHRLNFRS
jgi:hypothetical protein